jgi:Uma2 family endonuclease
MTLSAVRPQLLLEEFLAMPETKPASEYNDGKVWQKPMPQGKHSCLQVELCKAVNQVGQPGKIAYAFSELRCTFGGRSFVPDISVFRWNRIPRDELGEVDNHFLTYPDWAIEILSPDQSATKVLDKLLHCSEQGTELGWILDAREKTILTVDSSQRLQIFRGDTIVPLLPELELHLTTAQILGWLVL